MSEGHSTTRRDFMRGTACGALGVALGLKVGGAVVKARTVEGRAKVVLIRNADVIDASNNCNAQILAGMLDDAVVELFGGASPLEAWRKILKPTDVLGIKTNIWQFLHTPPELEQAIKARAMEIGIKESDISINDRTIRTDPVFQRATALINARPLRIHHWAGIGGCIKNYIMFIPQPSALHGDSCADLGTLMKLPEVAGKSRLHILVVLTPQYWGLGPHSFNPKYIWPYKGLIVGTDPVAVDSVGVRLIREMQLAKFGEEQKGQTPSKHVGLAETRHGVGIADPARIDIVKLGWMEESLI
jgi:hypothetical protein